MRIAIVSDITPGNIGGVERFSHSMAEQLALRGILVDLYDRSLLGGWQERGFDRYLMSQRRNRQIGIAAARKIEQQIPRTDIILQNSIAGWSLRGRTNIPRIVVHHGTMRGLYHIDLPQNVDWKMKLNRYIGLVAIKGGLEQYTAQEAVSVSVSAAVTDELRQYYSNIEPIEIPNGIDTRHFSARCQAECRLQFGIDTEEFVVCFLARFGSFGKGFEEVLALAKIAWESKRRIRFLIGTDKIPTGWPPNVIFVRNVAYEKLPELYSAANLFLFPTRYEGCSYSLLEAMACELPVLTTRVGYAKDLHRDIEEFSPYILAKNDVAKYWSLMEEIAGNPEQAKKIGLIGAGYVRRRNDMSCMVDSYIGLFRQLLENKKEA